jgi:hypothetical protein
LPSAADDIDPRELGLDKPAYPLREAAKIAGVTHETVYKGIRAGTLPSFLDGGRRFILAGDLARFILGRIRPTEAMTRGNSPMAVALEIYRATRTKPIDRDGEAEAAG